MTTADLHLILSLPSYSAVVAVVTAGEQLPLMMMLVEATADAAE